MLECTVWPKSSFGWRVWDINYIELGFKLLLYSVLHLASTWRAKEQTTPFTLLYPTEAGVLYAGCMILTTLVSAKSEEWSTLKCNPCSNNNVFVWWQVCHGDIKTENVMVTGWNWVLLTVRHCKLQFCYSFFRKITLQTSTSSFTHLDVAAVILHQKGFLISDRPIRGCQKVF